MPETATTSSVTSHDRPRTAQHELGNPFDETRNHVGAGISRARDGSVPSESVSDTGIPGVPGRSASVPPRSTTRRSLEELRVVPELRGNSAERSSFLAPQFALHISLKPSSPRPISGRFMHGMNRPKVAALAIVAGPGRRFRGDGHQGTVRSRERGAESTRCASIDRTAPSWTSSSAGRWRPQRVGEVVIDPPASVFPHINGVWRWTNAKHPPLPARRAGSRSPASTSSPSRRRRSAPPRSRSPGEREFVIKTDDFLVRHVTWGEQPFGQRLRRAAGRGQLQLSRRPGQPGAAHSPARRRT